MTVIQGTRLGPYEIVAPVGAGGMGEVFRARDTRLGRDVALKVLPASFAFDADRLRRFEQEARASAALNHPNIVAIYDVGTDQGVPYVVSELLEGQSLRQVLQAGPLRSRKAIDYAVQIATGLATAHDRGIVHRDVKPENIFITKEGRAKLLDFGLAKLTRPAAASDDPGATIAPTIVPTEVGVVVGTAGYMSPEQLRGEEVDGRSDIFSFGAVLYELFSGQRAFHGKTAADTMSAILTQDPAQLPSGVSTASPAIERVIRRCLEKNPAERFQSAWDITFALDALSTASGLSEALPAIPAPPVRRVRTVVAAAGAAGVLAVGLAAGWFLHRPAAPASMPEIKQLTFERGYVESARFSPDSQSVVYGASWEGRPQELLSVRVDRPEARSLGIMPAVVFGVSKASEIAIAMNATRFGPFVTSGTLARVPLLGGTPREVLENVMAADWSPDGNQLAVIRVGPPYRLEWPVGKVIYEATHWFSHVRISRDGKLVAFADHPVGGDDGTLVVMDQAGKQVASIPGWATIQGIAWSGDGSEVWFTATKLGGARALYGATLDGRVRLLYRSPITLTLQDVLADGRVLIVGGEPRSEVRGVLAGSDAERTMSAFDWALQPVISDDGAFVVYSESGEASETYGIFMRRADGSAPVRLGDGWYPGVSHDGKLVSALSRERNALWVYPVGAGEARKLDTGNIEQYTTAAAWLPGSRVLFSAVERGSSKPRAFVQELAGKPVARPRPGSRPSPDGSRYVCRDGTRLGVCAADSDRFDAIPNAADMTIAGWTADGSALFAYTVRDSAFDVFRVNPATGVRTPFRRIMPNDPTGLIALSNLNVGADGRVFVYNVSRTLSQLYLLDGLR